MPEEKPQQGAVDSRGVPLENKVAELERKLNEKYEKELAETRKELNEMKSRWAQETQPEASGDEVVKAELTDFVRQPKDYLKRTLWEMEVEKQKPEAENWLRTRPGYKSEFDTEIIQIIAENQLGGMPMNRAKTAWEIFSARKKLQEISSKEDETKRQESVTKTGGEGTGASISKERQITRNDVLKKLAEAESTGDIDASIKYISMLEDIR